MDGFWRQPSDRRQELHDHRHLRDRLDAPGRRRSSWTSRRRGPRSNFAKDQISSIYVEATDPAQYETLSATIEKAHPGVDAREHERGSGQLRLADGAGRQAAHDDRQPGASWWGSWASSTRC